MKFGEVPLAEARGAVLAHSVATDTGRLRKGRVLSPQDIDRLRDSGIASVTVARLEEGDVDEDSVADRLATALCAAHMSKSAPFTGRCNIFADRAGLFRVDGAAVGALNRVDEAITLATLPDATRVSARQMLATVKVIPYGVPGAAVDHARKLIGTPLSLHPFRPRPVTLIQTRLPTLADKLLDKGERVTRNRLAPLGLELGEVVAVDHETSAVADAVASATGEMILILGASATSDRADTCPAGLQAAGGTLGRFGMPVDPGNLLFVGTHKGRDVVGLPGCARAPALNGVDWVLERLAADLPVTHADIADMGVGGLLKEIPTRPQPRGGNPSVPARPRVEAIILAAGSSSRMAGRDKLMEDVDGAPLLARMADAALASQADRVQVVLPPDNPARARVLADKSAVQTIAPDAASGMAASIRAGLSARAETSDAVLIILADMPEITAGDIDRLIAAFDPAEGRSIVQASDADGRAGHPVLFGRRFFESLQALGGDQGARGIIADAAGYRVMVALPGAHATTDLDTPEAWDDWRARRSDR